MNAFSNGKSLWNQFLRDIKVLGLFRSGDHVAATQNAEKLIPSYDKEIEKIRKKQRVRDEQKRELKRKEEELKKQHIEEYWLSHAEEKRSLEEKIQQASDTIEELKKEIANIQERAELKALHEKESNLKEQLRSAGMFQGKKKKMLQEEIDSIISKYKPLNEKIEKKAEPINARISEQQKIINEIKAEFSKERKMNKSTGLYIWEQENLT